MLRCPVCKADNSQGPNCRRCRADLSLLFALEEQREHAMAEARAALAEAPARSLREAMRADQLRSDDTSRRLVAVAALSCRDFALAWRTYALVSLSPSQ
jgi:hypothetical protein